MLQTPLDWYVRVNFSLIWMTRYSQVSSKLLLHANQALSAAVGMFAAPFSCLHKLRSLRAKSQEPHIHHLNRLTELLLYHPRIMQILTLSRFAPPALWLAWVLQPQNILTCISQA